MPGLDGTGPMGMGPGTGWGLGWCYRARGGWYGPLRGLRGRPPWASGWGRGLGRGFRWRWWARAFGPWSWGPPPSAFSSKEEEAEWLKERMEDLKEELQRLERRLGEIEEKGSN